MIERYDDLYEGKKICAKMRERITGAFVLIILIGQPLILDNYYSDILETKYKFYYISMLSMFILLFLTALYSIKMFGIKSVLRNRNWRFSVADWSMIVFWVSALISTVFSDYKYEAFWGNEGHLNGLFLLTIYFVSYFCISRFWKFKNWYITVFIVVGIIVCMFGIGDYLQLGFLQIEPVRDDASEIFASTLGNINIYTSYVAMVVAASVVLFLYAKDRKKEFLCYICVAISIFALITGRSDNGYLALGALFGFIPFYAFRTRAGAKKYLVLIATFFTSIQLIKLANNYINCAQIDGITNIIIEFKYLPVLVIGLWGIISVFYFYDLKTGKQKNEILFNLTGLWSIFLITSILLIIFILYDCNIAGNMSRYGKIGRYVIFDNDWGNNRGFAWKMCWEIYRGFPLKKKMFGCGPDTLAILTVQRYLPEMISQINAIFNTAHNEYLQYLVTNGFIGMSAYIVFIGSFVINTVKNSSNNPFVMACVAAVMCYSAQAVVNITVPIVTPIMFVILAMGVAGKDSSIKTE